MLNEDLDEFLKVNDTQLPFLCLLLSFAVGLRIIDILIKPDRGAEK